MLTAVLVCAECGRAGAARKVKGIWQMEPHETHPPHGVACSNTSVEAPPVDDATGRWARDEIFGGLVLAVLVGVLIFVAYAVVAAVTGDDDRAPELPTFDQASRRDSACSEAESKRKSVNILTENELYRALDEYTRGRPRDKRAAALVAAQLAQLECDRLNAELAGQNR